MIIFFVMLMYGLFHPVTPKNIRTPDFLSSTSQLLSSGNLPLNISTAREDFYLSKTEDIFYPIFQSSQKARGRLHLIFEKSFDMSFFGRNLSLFLNSTGIFDNDIRVSYLNPDGSTDMPLSHSDLHCHYEGVVQNCNVDGSLNCTEGTATISICGSGLYGFVRIEDGDFLLQPVQADEANR